MPGPAQERMCLARFKGKVSGLPRLTEVNVGRRRIAEMPLGRDLRKLCNEPFGVQVPTCN